MTFALTWLAETLRAAGVVVIEQHGWQSRGRAEMGTVKGGICHHTGGPLRGTNPSLATVLNGRADLPGPLSHLYLGRDGVFHVLAAGRCNHAGDGSWQGVQMGNSSFIGIEAENAGTGADPWPPVQIEAYARGVAAILSHIRAPAIMCAGHKEFALPKGRKVDPTFDMDKFREAVAHFMAGGHGTPPAAPAPTMPHEAMLKRGDHGDSVKRLQMALGFEGNAIDGDFGEKTEAALKDFQRSHGLEDDGLAGPKTWEAFNG
jgi:hypothetical protein